MKVLIFSDSHGNTENMARVVEKAPPNAILHLGDGARDAAALEARFPQIPLLCVRGNCDDPLCNRPAERLLTWKGARIYMTHGHLYRVKEEYMNAVDAACAREADVLLFGHTHLPMCARIRGIWVLNPGSIRDSRRPTYGLMQIEDSGVRCETRATWE